MKKLHSITLIALVSLWLTSATTKANLIQAGTPTFGLNSLTIDTATQLGWLNLTASAGLSYDQVLAATQSGGMFSGYRFATDQEVLALFGAPASHHGRISGG